MRVWLPLLVLLLPALPGRSPAQQIAGTEASEHVAVEATTVVLDQRELHRLGLGGVALSAPGAEIATSGREAGNVRVGSRVGGLEVAAWLDVARERRAVRRESTQRLVVLSGSAAEVSGQTTLVGAYGGAVQAGPALWVQPTALEDGRVRLRLWSSTGDVRAGRYGVLEQAVPVEASTEIIVPSGTPVLVARSEALEEQTRAGLLRRAGSSAETEAWIVVRARVVDDPAQAFPLPEGIPRSLLYP